MSRGDFRKRLTDCLIEFMEEHDGLPWQKGWEAVNVRPFNPGTGAKYRGGNVLNLLYGALERESDDPRWMTLKQANAAGYSVKKGAKGELVEYWDWGQQKAKPQRELDADGKPVEPDATKGKTGVAAPDDDEEISASRKPLVFYAVVFNGSDIAGLPEIKRDVKWQPNELADQLIAATGAKIEHRALSKTAGGRAVANVAYFDNRADGIVMPPRSSFKSESDYYATALHELAHWTGHKSRLDRGLSAVEFGTPEYAKEELRAEIASMFLNSMVGIEGNVQNHARYASNWIEVLKKDKHELFRAAKDAEKIVDHIFEYAPELKALVESRLQDNLLPKDPPQRKRDSGVGVLPNFMPPEAAKEPAGTGRQDSRWASFESSVKGEAKRYGIPEAAVEETFSFVEPRFSELIDSAERNGYTVDDMNAMLVRQLVEEMRANDERRQQWDKFAGQVREASVGIMSPERVELALQGLHQQYLRVVQEGAQNGWDKEQTDKAVRSVVFGDNGRRPVTPDFVKERFLGGATAEASADADDDLLLMPTGASLTLGDALPADAAAMADERISPAP